MKRWTRIITLLLLAVLLAGLTACGRKEEKKVQSYAFSAAVVGSPGGFDPALASSDAEKIAAVHLFENLMRLQSGKNGTDVVGALASSWECIDNLDGTETYVFRLRQDAKWSDGRGVWAADFVNGWKHLVAESTGSPNAEILNMVAGYEEARAGDPDALQVRANGRNTLEVDLSCRCPYFLRSVCTAAATMPRRSDLAEKSGLVTNGPYAVKSYEDGVLTMDIAENYYDRDRLGPRTITLHFCDTAQQAVALWDEGKVDFVCGVAEESVAEQGDWLRQPCPEVTVLIVNQMAQQLESVALRQILSLAIDRTALASLAGSALHTPAEGLVPDGITSSDGSAFRTPEDIHIDNSDYARSCELARELLEQAEARTAANRLTDLTILYADQGVFGALAEEIRDGWQEELGIPARLRGASPEDMADALRDGTFHMAIITCRADRNDAEAFLQTWQSGYPENFALFHSSAYDMLLRVAAASSSSEARDAYLSDAERLLVEQGNVIPLYFTNRVYRLRSELTGLFSDGLGVFRFDAIRAAAG